MTFKKNMGTFGGSLLTLLSLLAVLPAFAAKDKPRANIHAKYNKQTHQVVVTNNELAPYTLTFDFPLFINATVNCNNPCTVAVYPGVHPVLNVGKIKPLEPWRFRYRYRYRKGDFRSKINRKHIYALPYAKGANYKMGQAYNGSFTHKGDYRYALDFHLPLGTPIHAARAGKVIWTVNHFTGAGITEKFKGRDNRVEIIHDDGSVARYGHMQQYGVKVKRGQRVKEGQLLGYSGNTGFSKGPHMHFQVYLPLSGKRSITFPTLFRTHRGLEILKTGQAYRNP